MTEHQWSSKIYALISALEKIRFQYKSTRFIHQKGKKEIFVVSKYFMIGFFSQFNDLVQWLNVYLFSMELVQVVAGKTCAAAAFPQLDDVTEYIAMLTDADAVHSFHASST